jgi:lysophospholipase L1-like esterase
VILLIQDIYAQKKVVILGSSTAAGTGASTYSLSWVGRVQQYYRRNTTDGKDTIVYNLALGGSKTYNGLPTGYQPPSNRPYPDTARNITKALAYNPDIIIISYVSNDAMSGYSARETQNNLSSMSNIAKNAGVSCYVTTTQPRNDLTSNFLSAQLEVRKSVLDTFGNYALNYWDNLVTQDGLYKILPQYNSGDGIHVNDSGHAVLYRQVMGKNIFQTQPTFFTTASAGSILCYGSTTTLNVAASGGTAPYKYSIDGINYQTLNTFKVKAGNYTAYVKDNTNNIATTSILVVQPQQLVTTIQVKHITCFEKNDGSLAANSTGGISPYLYSLNNDAYKTNSRFDSLPPNSYAITTRDANGCLTKKTLQIAQPPKLEVSISATEILCYGNLATISAAATGGSGTKLYSVNGVTFQSSSNFSVKAGTYSVVAKDGKGCTASSNAINITQPPSISTSITKTDVSCYNLSNGSLSVVASGGVGKFQYSLNGITYQNSGTFNNLVAAKYSVYIKDSTGCSITSSQTITQPALLSVTLSAKPILCSGGSTTLVAKATGGKSTYLYSFDGGQTFKTSYSLSIKAGVYSVKVMDSNGCTASQTISISDPPLLSIQASKVNVSCYGNNDGSITVSGVGGFLPYQYSISGGTYQTSNVFNFLKAGSYTVRIKDSLGCIKALSITITQPTTPCSTSTITATNSIAVRNFSLNVKVVPNPSSSSFLVSMQGFDEGIVEIHVIDLEGRILYKTKVLSSKTLTFGSQLSPGIYIVEAIQGSKTKKVKIIKS